MKAFKQHNQQSNTTKHQGDWLMCKECDKRIAHHERQGLTHSDAQGVAAAEHMKATSKK